MSHKEIWAKDKNNFYIVKIKPLDNTLGMKTYYEISRVYDGKLEYYANTFHPALMARYAERLSKDGFKLQTQ
jgi:hypothetical protein